MSTFPGGFVPVAPPADGLRLAFAAARRRRNRKAAAAGAAGLLAAVALLASTGGAGDRTLLQEPVPPATNPGLGVLPGGNAAPQPSLPPATTTSSVTVYAAPGAAAARPGGGGSSTGGGSAGAVAPTGGSRSRTAGTKPVSGPMERSTGLLYTNDLACPVNKQQERQRGLCTDVYGSSNGNGAMTLTAEVCNVGTTTELLSYATARELDLTVKHAGLEVWRWSLGRHFADSPHEITVGAQECAVWTTTWTQVDAHGVPVKAGSYDLVADLDADEVAASDRHPSYPLTIS